MAASFRLVNYYSLPRYMIFYLFMFLLYSYKLNLPRNMVDFSATKNHQTCGKNEESKHVDLTGNDGDLNNQK